MPVSNIPVVQFSGALRDKGVVGSRSKGVLPLLACLQHDEKKRLLGAHRST